VQAAPQQTGGRVCVADRIEAGRVCPPGGGEPFFGLGETACQEVQPAKQRVPPWGGRRLRDHDRELSGRGRLAAAQKKLHGIKQQPVSIRAVRRQRGRLRQPDRGQPPGRHAARPAPGHHLISSSQSVDARTSRLNKITQLRGRDPRPMTSRVVFTGQVILGQPAICPLEPRLKPRFQVGRREPVPQTPPNAAVITGQPSARSLKVLGQPRIRAARRREPVQRTPPKAVVTGQPSARSLEVLGQPRIQVARRRESMPETLLWRADLGRPPMQLAAPGRFHLAVDDQLADSISELNLPIKPTDLAELAELRTFREQSGLDGLG